ncbi:YqeG family HAD IIIA-type phosphatase [Thermosynechococcus sp. HN-54]|uniref:YqeG family HAD IIIA-type phosphatase n=1 Tax=Thermosynechococcus sp. HN-54 TaxID=2933959 RepID=UPI00202CAF5A|nr:YqeG family HAD IIIA-type phosphatase [Thermosynechococcus sp. HN-54]URR34328.1 YqeG family HAD IIIA-type phosphatase [Thermosynechococcus sp. HN-54]
MVTRSLAALLQPDLILEGTIEQLHPRLLQKYDLRGMVLDVDDTLLPTWDADLPPQILRWLLEIKCQMPIWLVSNNLNHRRIERIAQQVDLPFLMGAGKPSRRKLRQAVQAMNLPYHQIAMVGDRLFTDILAGNRLGMFTILVQPVLVKRVDGKSWVRNVEFWLARQLGTPLEIAPSSEG